MQEKIITLEIYPGINPGQRGEELFDKCSAQDRNSIFS